MQINARHDFKSPKRQVIARFRDPARLETALKGMRVKLTRTAEGPAPAWNGSVKWRGNPRPLTVALTEPSAGQTLLLTVKSDIAEATLRFDFADLPEAGCRVTAEATPIARNPLTRIAVASMGLIKGKLSKRLAKLVEALGKP